jgi:hypothetical protein
MPLPFKDPVKLLERALKAKDLKEFDKLYDESEKMFNHEKYKEYAMNNRPTNNNYNNIGYQYNVAGGPNNGVNVAVGYGPSHHHSGGSAVAPMNGLRSHLG